MNWLERLSNDYLEIIMQAERTLYLSLVSLGIACLLAIPLGILLTRLPRIVNPAFAVISVIQTIPSLALLGFLIPFVGIGTTPAIIALSLFSLLPILQNTYTGISEVDKSLIEAGRGMGMKERQIIWMVQLPLARGVIIAGVRTATVHTIGMTTIASFIGAGGLGELIISGISRMDNFRLLEGAIPVAVLAVAFSLLLLLFNRLMTPKGLRARKEKRVDSTITSSNLNKSA